LIEDGITEWRFENWGLAEEHMSPIPRLLIGEVGTDEDDAKLAEARMKGLIQRCRERRNLAQEAARYDDE